MFTILINYFRRRGATETAAAAEGDVSVMLQPVDHEAAAAEIVFEHPEWGDDVLRSKKTGAVINPMEMDKVIATLLAAICSIGIVLNLEIVLRIAKDKALRKKPRYVIQLAIAVSAICTLIENLILVVQYVVPGSKKNNHQQQEDLICLFFIAVVGLSYDSMLLNRLLSLVDCFAAIAYPFWHRRKVTTRRVTYWLIGLNLLALPLIIKSPFIAGYLQLYCAVQESHLIAIQLPMAVLFTLCFVFYCVDFAIAWQLLPRPSSGSRAAVPSTMPSNNRLSLPKGCRGGLRRKKAMKKKKKENSIEMACSNLNPPAAAAADSAPAASASASNSQSAMNSPQQQQQQQRHESSSPQQQVKYYIQTLLQHLHLQHYLDMNARCCNLNVNSLHLAAVVFDEHSSSSSSSSRFCCRCRCCRCCCAQERVEGGQKVSPRRPSALPAALSVAPIRFLLQQILHPIHLTQQQRLQFSSGVRRSHLARPLPVSHFQRFARPSQPHNESLAQQGFHQKALPPAFGSHHRLLLLLLLQQTATISLFVFPQSSPPFIHSIQSSTLLLFDVVFSILIIIIDFCHMFNLY